MYQDPNKTDWEMVFIKLGLVVSGLVVILVHIVMFTR